MGWRLLRRLVGLGLTVLVVSFLTYAGLTYAPGDAAEALLGEHATAEQVQALRQQMGLDAPLPSRYGRYMAAAVGRGDLGRSLVSGRRVSDLVLERLPLTLLLALTSITLAAVGGLAIGLFSASRHGSRLDLVLTGTTVLGLALPSYWVALLLVMLFSLQLRLLPVFGSGTPAHMVLPAVTLALPTAAVVGRISRANVLESLHADYVRTALAKGLTSRRALLHHVIPNSLIPTITLLGLSLGHLIGGAFIVETIFAWPGLGRLTVQAIFDRDIPVVMGAVLVVAPLCLAINLGVDLLQAALDPRLRHEAL